MKKSVLLLLIFGCSLAVFAGCGADNDEIPTAPPTLTVTCGETGMEAMGGTSSWTYDKGDGTWSGVAIDCVHPLDESTRERMPRLTADETLSAELKFAVEPKAVSVRCWAEEYWGALEAEEETADVERGSVALKDAGYIYEVTAEWDSPEQYEGLVTYSFYAAPAQTPVEN